MKEQKFNYVFSETKDFDILINAKHIRHAIGNCDTFPCRIDDTTSPEGKLQSEIIECIINAIEACPKMQYFQGKVFPASSDKNNHEIDKQQSCPASQRDNT